MKIQHILKTLKTALPEKNKYSQYAIHFDFEENLIVATNGFICVKVNYNFEENHNLSKYNKFIEKKSYNLNAIFIDDLMKYLDLGHNLFETLDNNQQMENQYTFPNHKALSSFRENEFTDNFMIKFSVENQYKILKILKDLKQNTVDFYFSQKSLSEYKTKDVSIITAALKEAY
jgi:transposase-like protein